MAVAPTIPAIDAETFVSAEVVEMLVAAIDEQLRAELQKDIDEIVKTYLDQEEVLIAGADPKC